MKRHKLAFVDIETTGFSTDTQEIIELGVVIAKPLNDDATEYEVVEELDLKIKPEHIETADVQALRVNGYDEGAWIFAHSLKEAMQIFSDKTEGCVFVAHNVAFDYSFIDKAFHKTGVEDKLFYAKMDTISMAFAKLHKKKDIERFSLKKLCEYFGIENNKAHTALSDARATFELFHHLMKL
ncbi:MAG: DNA polymerase III epsilon subunit-like protein [Candidatus Paceibacteria bacterium]|jgi:DNA polymerase III epsilon subunit-like protein